MAKDKYFNEFEIAFNGLSVGRYEYDYELDHQFFEKLEHPELRDCSIHVHLDLDRQKTMLVCGFTMKGTVKLPCDRCGEDFDQPVEGKRHLVVRLDSNEEDDGDDDLVCLPPSDHILNVSQYIYEYVTLLVPARRVHPDNGCDPEMLKKINDLSVGHDEDENHDPNDPRWQALRNIKFDS